MRYLFLPLLALCLLFVAFSIRPNGVPCANTGNCGKPIAMSIENGTSGTFMGQPVAAPAIDPSGDVSNVLGTTTDSGPKHIYVDLTNQTLYAYEGSSLFMQTLVSTGRWFPTPPGEYTIWMKVRSTRMSGGEGADAYDLPNVPFVMFFYNDKVPKASGFSLHGAYWHDNFGHPMSHGCVNMRTIDAQALYDWVHPTTVNSMTFASTSDPGTPVSICTTVTTQSGGTPVCVE